MNDSLKIAVVSLDMVWADKGANLEAVEKCFAGIDRDTDVVVLPELFTTGFIPDEALAADVAESISGNTVDVLHRLSRQYSVAVCGSFLAKSGHACFNRAFFIEPSGEETFYDKRHLFALSRESVMLSPGMDMPPVVRFRGWNISMIVCYDLRFPVWCRNVDHAYDVMLVPANWPQSRRYPWEHLIIARSIENHAYYVGADRSGVDDYGDYSDMSIVTDFYGRKIGKTDESTGVMYAETDREALQKARRSMPTVEDADIFSVERTPRRLSRQNDN